MDGVLVAALDDRGRCTSLRQWWHESRRLQLTRFGGRRLSRDGHKPDHPDDVTITTIESRPSLRCAVWAAG